MKLKQLYVRFRDWQRNPFHFKPMAREAHQCLNCGQQYKGNYCPNCGQKSDTGRLGWHSVFAKVFDVWDVEKNALPTTLLHLLLRPGYMICDYLDGRRRPYYSPVMLVFILAIAVDIIMGYPYLREGGYQLLIVAGITIVLLAAGTFINRYGERRRKATH